MPRYPRPSTPRPTAPPDPAEQRLVKRIEPWKILAGVVVALVGLGIAVADYDHRIATRVEVEAVRSGAASALGAAQAGTGAQLGALQSQISDLRSKQERVEGKLDVLLGMTQQLLDRQRP